MMPGGDVTRITYDFQFKESHSYHVFPARDIDLRAQKEPGIYAWYIRVLRGAQNADDLMPYSALFGAKRLNLVATGTLGETYNGQLNRAAAFASRSPEFAAMIASASTIFCPPLYIGISLNIHKRLKSHRDALQLALSGGTPSIAALTTTTPSSPTSSEDSIEDTDQESSLFGERLGRLLREQNISDINNLFIKVIYQDAYDRKELLHSEAFVNRTFLPLYGRK
jgi:hypothetical protein